jgi:hypothetical protein
MIGRLAKWWKDRRQANRDALMPERKILVSFTDAGIRASYPDGTTEAIEWPSVQRIYIETNDSGPAGADFWWVLEGDAARCAFPQGATGEAEAARVVASKFAGFDDMMVVKAVGSTSNARFVCWERKNAL